MPVLLAGDAEFDSKLVILGSYINISDFPNRFKAQVADYLLFFTDRNEQSQIAPGYVHNLETHWLSAVMLVKKKKYTNKSKEKSGTTSVNFGE